MSMHPSELHCGEIFYEKWIEMLAITEPYENRDGAWIWKARNTKTDEVVDYFWTGYGYGPQIYDYQAYTSPTDPHTPDYIPKGTV